MAEDQNTVLFPVISSLTPFDYEEQNRYFTNTEEARKNSMYMEKIIWKAEFKMPFVNQKGQGSPQFSEVKSK